jgi:hypothetical protein
MRSILEFFVFAVFVCVVAANTHWIVGPFLVGIAVALDGLKDA